MKITTSIEIKPATVIVDNDGDGWVLLPNGSLKAVGSVSRLRARETVETQDYVERYAPFTLWTPDET